MFSMDQSESYEQKYLKSKLESDNFVRSPDLGLVSIGDQL